MAVSVLPEASRPPEYYDYRTHEERAKVFGQIEYAMQNPNTFGLQPAVAGEMITLLHQGYDIRMSDVRDPDAMGDLEQASFNGQIAQMEAFPEAAHEEFMNYPAMSVWQRLRMRALALHPLYNAGSIRRGPDATLGIGISKDVFKRGLFSRPKKDDATVTELVSAADLVRETYAGRGEAKALEAERIIADHEEFIDTPVDDESLNFYRGSADGRAIRTRGLEAANRAVSRFTDEHGRISRQDLRVMSVACGAVGPFAQMSKEIAARGGAIKKAILIDQDPMALAVGKNITENMGLTDQQVELQILNIIRDKIPEYVEHASIDIADLLGIVEYLSEPLAIRLLQQVAQVMKPGGVIVWGNMLNPRPQYTMFKDIVKWPNLKERTLGQSIDLMLKAGFAKEQITSTPVGKEGVYAVYEIRIPEEGPNNVVPIGTAAMRRHIARPDNIGAAA